MNAIHGIIKWKNTIFLLFMVSFVLPKTSHAQSPVTKAMKASFQNRWTGNYLEFAGGSPMLLPENHNSWEVLPVPNVPECFFIKLSGNELYLNVENGLAISAILPGWHSAMWKLKKMEGTEYYQIINYWKGLPLNNETQKLEVSPAQDGYFSAMWTVNLTEMGTNNPSGNGSPPVSKQEVEYENYSFSNPYILVQEAADGGTDPAIFGKINILLLKNGNVEKTWPLFNRTEAAGSRVIAPEKKTITLSAPTDMISIPMKDRSQYEVRIEANLYDYDQSSSNDLLGNSGNSMSIADAYDAPMEVSLFLFGEGKVKIAATLTRSGSNGFLEVYEESKAGGAYNTNDDPDPWIYSATRNWMGLLPDNTFLMNISIPGTHDSGAKFGGPNAAAQSWTITEQLNSGIRYLDIRCRRIEDKFAIHHGIVFQNLMFGDVLDEVRAFLRSNPQEAVIMRIKSEHDSAEGSRPQTEIWNNYLSKYSDIFYTGSKYDVSLGEVRGKVFVLCESSCSTGNGMLYKNEYVYMQDKYDVRFAAHEFVGESSASLPSKKRLIRELIDRAEGSDFWYLNYLSGGTSTFIRDVASQTNASTFEYLGRKSKKRKLGILIMDYPGEQLIYRIIKSNFNLRF